MSADPERVGDATTYSSGQIFRNLLYDSSSSDDIRPAMPQEPASREWNQRDVPPFVRNMHKTHPCLAANLALGKCSDAQDPNMLLAMRSTVCWAERQALQKCLVQNKRWKAPPPAPWWKFWDR